MSNKNVTLKEKVNGVVGDVLLPNTTAANVYDAAKGQALSQTLVNTPDKAAVGYPPFSELSNYAVGDKVYKDNKVYRFTEAHPAGSWNSGHVEPWSAKADIDAILALIPSDASSANKLADKAYVDNSIATDSATFRGTYNEVSDLELTPAATRTEIATALASAVSTADNNDYAFVQIPTDASTPTEIARIERYKFNGSDWAFEYELNNSGFTTAQWAAINSGITTEKVAKLDALPTAANLYTKEQVDAMIADIEENYLKKGTYSADTAVGLADNIRGDVYADEQFSLRMTGGEANEVGGIGVVQVLKGAGAAIAQLFPEGAGHDFSGDVSLDGTGGNAEAVVRYSDQAGTVEMGYLLAMEAFVSQTLTQEQLDAIAAKDTGKQDRDKAVWLTPAGAITSAPTIESGQTEVTFSGWRIAMRVKASEVRDSSASTYWFTAGTAGRQVYDVAVAEGIDGEQYYDSSTGTRPWRFYLANGWNIGSAMEYLNHMAAQGLPTHSVKAMSALLAVTKIGIKTVKSRNLLNPQTGHALLKAYVNDADGFVDNEYTMLGGLPSGSTMAFTSLLTGKTETLTMLDATHFVIPSDGWLQITGTLPESIIATWGGEKDNTAADEYATESHTWDVTKMFGTKSGGTEGHYYRFAKEGMRGAGSAQDVVELVGARGEVKVGDQDLGAQSMSWSIQSFGTLGLLRATISSAKTFLENNNKCSLFTKVKGLRSGVAVGDKTFMGWSSGQEAKYLTIRDDAYTDAAAFKTAMSGVHLFYELATPLTFTSLFLSASSTSDELTQMPADAIPLSEIQFADNNWSIEEAIYDAPEADANGVITPTAVTGQMRIQYSLDAAEQILTLQTEYEALEARVTALENA